MKFYEMKQKSDFLLFKCPEKGQFVSPETGDKFCIDDVVGGSEELFTLSLLQCCNKTLIDGRAPCSLRCFAHITHKIALLSIS